MKWVRKFWWVLLLIPLLLVGGFVIWAKTPLGPMPEAMAALQSDANVQVEQGQWYVFRPQNITPTTGAIIYPGGRVDPRSYAPYARELAIQGYLAVITPMPLNLAVLDSNQAKDVVAAYPDIKHWAVGGHSLGGAMAAHFQAVNSVSSDPVSVAGLFLWAAYPADTDDLSKQPIQAVSVYGTLDGLATGDKIDASKALMPATTQFVPIEGGNHAQFGWYGPQPGDNEATISREQQMQQTIEATAAMLKSLAP
jgi:hypothetical protein